MFSIKFYDLRERKKYNKTQNPKKKSDIWFYREFRSKNVHILSTHSSYPPSKNHWLQYVFVFWKIKKTNCCKKKKNENYMEELLLLCYFLPIFHSLAVTCDVFLFIVHRLSANLDVISFIIAMKKKNQIKLVLLIFDILSSYHCQKGIKKIQHASKIERRKKKRCEICDLNPYIFGYNFVHFVLFILNAIGLLLWTDRYHHIT